jgi:transposase
MSVEIKKKYNEAFMRMVVRESLKGELSVKELAKKFDLPHYNTVTVWRRYLKNKIDDIEDLGKPLSKDQKRDASNLKKRTEELEKALTMANLKIAGLETMIDIAEEELHIQIRKKPGTKQSKP